MNPLGANSEPVTSAPERSKAFSPTPANGGISIMKSAFRELSSPSRFSMNISPGATSFTWD